MRKALIPILFGVPGWVRALTPGAIPQVAADFANNRYWQQGAGTRSFTDLFALTRATPETVTSSGGIISYAASGQPAVSDLGLAVWESRTNLAKQSVDLTNAAWAIHNGTISTDGTLAPDGSAAQKFTAAAGNTYHEISNTISIAIVSGSTYQYTVYVKPGTNRYVTVSPGTSAADYAIAVFDVGTGASGSATQTAVGGTSGTIVSSASTYIGGGWYRLSLIAHMAGTAGHIQFGLAGAATGNTISVGDLIFNAAGTESAYFFLPDLQLGDFASPAIPTTSAAASQGADVVVPAGLLKSIFASPSGWLYANVAGSPSDNTPTIWDKDNANNTPAYFDTTSTITSIMSGVLLRATLGSGAQSGKVKSLVTWNAAGRSLAANGGTVVSDANTLAGSNTPYLGSGGGSTFFYDGNFTSIAAGLTRLPDALVKSLST